MKKAVIFDLDGTILDTIADLHEATNFAIKKLGLKAKTLQDTKRAIGDGLYNLIDRLTDHQLSDDEIKEGCLFFIAYYKDHLLDHTKPYDGIIKLMEDLKIKGIKIFVLSNKDDFGVQVLINHFFPGLVDVSLGHLQNMPIKPSVAPFELLLKDDKHLLKDDLIMIGDSKTDILTANNYGIDCLIVPWGYGKDFEHYSGFKMITATDDIKANIFK